MINQSSLAQAGPVANQRTEESDGWMSDWMSDVIESSMAGWMAAGCWELGLLAGWGAGWLRVVSRRPSLPLSIATVALGEKSSGES
jgi:hypothetical protein